MREAREEHHATGQRRRVNGRPPRRPVHYGAPRPRKPPRGRVRKQLARLVGLTATALLLAVGVTVVLMVTRDNGSEPPETFAAADPTPAPTAAPKKAKPRRPRLTPQQRASRDAAVTQLRSQGFEPVALADYKPRQSLRVLIGRPKASTGMRGRRAFFFVREEYLGADAAEPSQRVRVVRQRKGVITLAYSLFSASDRACCPTAGTVRVRFAMVDGRLLPQDPVPPPASRLPATS